MADGTQLKAASIHHDRHTSEYVNALRERISAIKSSLPESYDPCLDTAFARLLLGVERGHVIAISHTRNAIADRIVLTDIREAQRMLGHIRHSNSTPESALQQATELCRQVAHDFGLSETSLAR